jgi:hypothetical protein
MFIISLQRFGAVLGLLLLTALAFGQTAAVEPPIDMKMRQADVRLNMPVSLSADRIYLGELLEMLSAKTHVLLSIDENDSFSGVPITCELKQLPLANVMNSLWSLLGSQNGFWEWKAERGETATYYNLHPTAAVRKTSERSRQAMQAALEFHAERMISMAFLSPEERKAAGESFAASVAKENPALALTYFARYDDNEERWNAIRLFAYILSPDQRLRALRGERIDIPFNALNEEDHQLALPMMNKASIGRGETLFPVSPMSEENRQIALAQEALLGTIRFETDRSSYDYKVSSLIIYISLLKKGGGSGQGIFAVPANGLFSHFTEDWILSGDLLILDVDTHPLTVLAQFNREEIWNTVALLDYNIAQLAATEGISFMAVLPGGKDLQMPTPLDKTPAQYFAEMGKPMSNLMHKWHDGVLLINHRHWFYGDEGQYSYGIVKRLRARMRQQGGRLTLDDVVEPAVTLNGRQIQHLGEAFPAFEQGGGMTPFCLFYKRYPASWAEQGTPVDPKMRAFLQTAKLWPTTLKAKQQVVAIRIHDATEAWSSGTFRVYRLQFTTDNQKWGEISSLRILLTPPEADNRRDLPEVE